MLKQGFQQAKFGVSQEYQVNLDLGALRALGKHELALMKTKAC